MGGKRSGQLAAKWMDSIIVDALLGKLKDQLKRQINIEKISLYGC